MGAGNNKGESDRFPDFLVPDLGVCRLAHRPNLTLDLIDMESSEFREV